MDKFKLIIIEEEFLGYTMQGTNFAILIPDGGTLNLNGKKWRLASETDFKNQEVSFHTYRNNPEFLYDTTLIESNDTTEVDHIQDMVNAMHGGANE